MSVDVEAKDRVLVLQTQRPEKRNAIDKQMTLGISSALDKLDDDEELWVGILAYGRDLLRRNRFTRRHRRIRRTSASASLARHNSEPSATQAV